MKLACLLFGAWLLMSCVESTTYTAQGELSVSIPEELDVRSGGATQLPVTVVRGEGHTKAIALKLVGLPEGLSADPAEIPASESTGFITLRATTATLGVEYPVIINATSGKTTASDTSKLYVIGKAGTVQNRLSIPLLSISKLIGELPSQEGFLFFLSASYCLFDDRGIEDLSFADGGCIEPASRYLPPQVLDETHVRIQRDQKVVGVASYDDPQTADEIDGLVFFRTMPDGKFDNTYGPAGNDSKSFVPLPGYIARRVGVSATNEMVVWATNSAGAKRFVRVSARGELLASRELGREGDFGVERDDLLVQDDGKVVVSGSYQNQRFITRFNSDFTVDLYFGFNGVVSTGDRISHVIAIADGYLAVGQRAGLPTLWRLDTLGQPAPGFTTVGISYPELIEGHFVSAFAAKDRFYVASDSTVASVLAVLPDGSVDRSFAENGLMHIDYLDPTDQLLDLSPTTHSRADVWIRTSPMVRFKQARIWY